MRCFAFRRLVLLLAALALALGVAAGGAQAMDMGAKTAMTAAMDMPAAPDRCDGCGDDDGDMATDACLALCGAMTALPPVLAVVPPSPAERPVPLVATFDQGHAGPPDPHPPRPVVLS